jgi:polyphosphate kinase
VDLGSLGELASLPIPEINYSKFQGGNPIDASRSIFDVMKEKDVLLHHPYDRFDSTVQRLIVEGADDPDVMAIKLTLYRSGSQSSIVDALTRAAGAGKDVSVFVELKARFDEERNIHWARKLEQAGIHVVTGLVRLKTHAKTALVVRREGNAVRRYVHIGTGNYNAATANFYTDLGLLSANEGLGADLNDLFNELTGSSGPPQREFQRLLVAPTNMLKRFRALIKREIEHAQAGRGGRIRVKLNGLADKKIIGTLYKASQAGVEIDLIIRGICSLRPGVPGLSEHIRVFSILGRFLEHARIYYFANGGDPEYYIGSADWRPRNLRRRVEVVTPVLDPQACERLDEILEMELDDPTAWQMRPDGSYEQPEFATGVDTRSAQEKLIERHQSS